MPSSVRSITVDSADARALARFWAEVLGWNVYYDDDPEVLVAPAFPPPETGEKILFIPVPEAKTAKNRMHLDLAPDDRTRDEEVQRVVGLGARVVEDHRNPDGSGWVWLADPEGNEFCIERSAAERGPQAVQQWRLTQGS
ncbi:MAG: hypothetical protein QOD45_1806 [Pseudonocardiales bacterium]|nr:hypothetical protein [Pseudonocardiales bacterium]